MLFSLFCLSCIEDLAHAIPSLSLLIPADAFVGGGTANFVTAFPIGTSNAKSPSIVAAYDDSLDFNVKDILKPEVVEKITLRARGLEIPI